MMNGGRNSARSRRDGRPWVRVIASATKTALTASATRIARYTAGQAPGCVICADVQRAEERERDAALDGDESDVDGGLDPDDPVLDLRDHHRQAVGEQQHQRRREGEADDERRLGQRDGERLPADLDVRLRALEDDEREREQDPAPGGGAGRE